MRDQWQDPGDYWEARKNFGYYVLVRAWLDAISWSTNKPTSILDVGPFDTPVATWGEFDDRFTIDIQKTPPLEGVFAFQGDFSTWVFSERVTVVTCLQVLEHLPDHLVRLFAKKLLNTADYAIISVPFEWEAGLEPSHLQDPITYEKLVSIVGRPPDQHAIILDTHHLRLVGLWRNT